MPQYMLLVYEEEVDRDGQVERERDLPVLMQMHRSLREAGLLGTARALRSTETATSVRVRDGADRDHRRPVRRDQGGPGRLLRAGVRGSRRGAQAGGAVADVALGDARGASGHVGRRVGAHRGRAGVELSDEDVSNLA